MKKSIFTLLLGGIFLFVLQNASATNPISETVSFEMTLDHAVDSDFQKENIFSKFFSKVKKGVRKVKQKAKAAFYKIAGMFDDPTRKWMWFWLIFGLLGVILVVAAVVFAFGGAAGFLYNLLWYLGWASSLFSGISFVIWIIKLVQG